MKALSRNMLPPSSRSNHVDLQMTVSHSFLLPDTLLDSRSLCGRLKLFPCCQSHNTFPYEQADLSLPQVLYLVAYKNYLGSYDYITTSTGTSKSHKKGSEYCVQSETPHEEF